jgi:putative ABC transport system substrate-binding protein
MDGPELLGEAMRRRELISLLGGAAAWPLAARAQQPSAKVFRIGFLGLLNAGSLPKRTETFRASLRDLGYQEGRDFVIEYRWADGNYDRLPTLVEDLIRLKVDVIDTHGTPGVCAKQADVRFWGKSGDEDCAAKCLLMTQSGHCCP